MTFTYPAVFVPHGEDAGFDVEFPDLEGCRAVGPDLEDAVENARDAAYNWLMVEIEDETYEFPAHPMWRISFCPRMLLSNRFG